MSGLSAAVAVSIAMMAGCGRTLDQDPSIFGITPELRAVMREVIAEQDPSADVDQVVKAYMDDLLSTAKTIDVAPNAAGDYVLSAEQEETVNDFLAPGGAAATVAENNMTLRPWARSLLDESQAGDISAEREELLERVVVAQLIANLSG